MTQTVALLLFPAGKASEPGRKLNESLFLKPSRRRSVVEQRRINKAQCSLRCSGLTNKNNDFNKKRVQEKGSGHGRRY